jgi:hypothetical protein
MDFRHLAREHDALLESKWKLMDENQDLETIISRFRIVNQQDSKTIQELKQ